MATQWGRLQKRLAAQVLAVGLMTGMATTVAFDPSVAEARSGSSFGGGFRSRSSGSSSRSFGSSSSRSSSGSRSFGSSSSSRPSTSYRSSSTRFVPVPVPIPIGGSSYHYGNSGGNPTVSSNSNAGTSLFAFLFFLVWIVVIVIVVRKLKAKWGQSAGYTTASDNADVVMIQMGIHDTARDLQDTLEQLAAAASAGTETALAGAMYAIAQNLEARPEYIEYAAARQSTQLSLPKAEDEFTYWANTERSKYNREVLRVDKSGKTQQQKEWKTDGIRDEDGQLAVHEFFVVTVVLACRGEKFPASIQNHAELNAALAAMQRLKPDQLVALEVIWSPSARSDAMSRDDMTSRYPELRQL